MLWQPLQTAEALQTIKSKGSDASSALRGGFKSLFSTLKETEAELSRGAPLPPPPVLLPVMDTVTGPVGVFGVSLVELTAHESVAGGVPAMVAACAHTLHCIGLETKGLFIAEVRSFSSPSFSSGTWWWRWVYN